MQYQCPLCRDGVVQTKKGPEAVLCDKCTYDVPSGVCDKSGHRICLRCLLEYVDRHPKE